MPTRDAQPTSINPGDPKYPRALLGGAQPATLYAIGNVDILRQPLTAFFCSNRCPGSAILRALDLAAQFRNANRAVISGFHTPVEKECLGILLRGKSPIVICPARSLAKLRLPPTWKAALASGRLLLLSPFSNHHHRPTTENADRRNKLVAALAAEVIAPHVNPGGRLDKLTSALKAAGRFQCSPSSIG